MPPGFAITCPNWEYATIAGHDQLLRARAKSALIRLRNVEPPRARSLLKDTRNVHEQFFRDLTPQDFAYYAGHYRGELYICLRHYEVMVLGDPRVGHPPDKVLQSMANLAPQIDDALQQSKLMWRVPNAVFSPPEKLKCPSEEFLISLNHLDSMGPILIRGGGIHCGRTRTGRSTTAIT